MDASYFFHATNDKFVDLFLIIFCHEDNLNKPVNYNKPVSKESLVNFDH